MDYKPPVIGNEVSQPFVFSVGAIRNKWQDMEQKAANRLIRRDEDGH